MERAAGDAAAPRTRVLDPADLTEEELRPTERQDYFMPRRSSGPSGERAAAKEMAVRRRRGRAASAADPEAPRGAARRAAVVGEAPDIAPDDHDDAGAAPCPRFCMQR